MKPISIKQFPYLKIPLAADARTINGMPHDDQVWQLSFGSGETGTLELSTTYGLRARYMRIFPIFSEEGITIEQMRDYHSPVRIEKNYPNYIQLSFQPFEGIEAVFEYWVQDFDLISCRITVTNHTQEERAIGMDWVCVLAPDAGTPMKPEHKNIVNILQGTTKGLAPVMFITGGPDFTISPKPALTSDIFLATKESKTLTWAVSAKESPEDSFETARRAVAKNWDAEMALLEMTNSDVYQIESFLPEWDFVFNLSQRMSIFLAGFNQQEVRFQRTVDQNPLDDSLTQNPIFPLVIWYWLKCAPPAMLATGKQILLNWFESADLAFVAKDIYPFICSLSYEIYQRDGDKSFLGKIYPALQQYYQIWMTSDQIKSPTWRSVRQTGIERHPLFSTLFSWSQGVDARKVNAPDLTALLLIEAESMDQLALIMEDIETSSEAKKNAMQLRNILEDLWNSRSVIHFYSDVETRYSQKIGLIGRIKGNAQKTIEKSFDTPMRLLLRVDAQGVLPLQLKIHIEGKDAAQKNLHIDLTYSDFSWYLSHGTLTLNHLLTEVNLIHIEGAGKNDQTSLQHVYHRVPMISSLLPMWANSISLKMKNQIVKHNFAKAQRFNENFGMPEFIPTPSLANKIEHVSVSLPHSVLVIEALLKMGEIKLAAEHLTKIVTAQGLCLRNQGALFERYDVHTAQGFDSPYTWNSLFPIGLFLKVAGIEILSPTKVILHYNNPLPAKFKVSYRGLEIMHGLKETTITFPNGTQTQYHGGKLQIFEMK